MEPSRWEKMKMGAIMGGTVGLTIGLVFGFVHIARFGSGNKGIVPTLGQYMMGSAASFAFFMGIGTAIRSEGMHPYLITNGRTNIGTSSSLSSQQVFGRMAMRVPVDINQELNAGNKL